MSAARATLAGLAVLATLVAVALSVGAQGFGVARLLGED